MRKFLINLFVAGLFFALNLPSFGVSKAPTFVSISPAMTEIMYEIKAEDLLYAVSSYCDYPSAVKEKEKIGSGYFINIERVLTLKPRYILALDSSEFVLHKFKRFGIEPLCFKYPNIEAVYSIILRLGEITGKKEEAKIASAKLEGRVRAAKKGKGKRILYLVQTQPLITIGKKSFITDIIEKSGNYSVTSELDIAYPSISLEYAIAQNPDVIVLGPFGDDGSSIKKFFKGAEITCTSAEINSIISRPGPRVYKAVEYFAAL